jgi:hypothetical protein
MKVIRHQVEAKNPALWKFWALERAWGVVVQPATFYAP